MTIASYQGTGDIAVWKHLSTFMEIEKMKKVQQGFTLIELMISN
jgi:hypothetical protein